MRMNHWERRVFCTVIALSVLPMGGCFREDKKIKKTSSVELIKELPASELEAVAQRRGLSPDDLVAAVKTFVPTGGRDTHVGLFGTGTSGLVAIFAMPSMRILKYAGVFTPEPWQGYGYDDNSKALLLGSRREDISYTYGDMGLPIVSLTDGKQDGRDAFFVDAANARVALMALDDYETKQVLVNPIFRGSYPTLTPTANTEYVVQVTEAPEIPDGKDESANVKKNTALRGGATFWAVKKGAEGEHDHFAVEDSFTVELPPYLQGSTLAGRGSSAQWVFILGRCKNESPLLDGSSACSRGEDPAVLHMIDWKAAEAARGKATKIASHPFVKAETNVIQIELPKGTEKMALSPDGTTLAFMTRESGKVSFYDVKTLTDSARSSATRDAFGVPTAAGTAGLKGEVNLEGKLTDLAFGDRQRLYVTSVGPNRFTRVDVAAKKNAGSLDLNFEPVGITIPAAETAEPKDQYAVVLNRNSHGRTISVGPTVGLNPVLIDLSGEKMTKLYDMSVPIANALQAVIFPADLPKTVIRYKIGTEPRSGQESPVRTVAGQEDIVRDGDRVHVFATVIRSHITPDFVEVNEGDTVSFHITNLEQAQDQTHGFTIGTYNVHGSWEPGKTASVSFVANRPGVFPFYCTEFCSALHLEMEGYLLVKPRGWKPSLADMKTTQSASTEDDKAQYENKLRSIEETQMVIDSVVAWLKENNYERDQRAKSLVADAVAQLELAKGVKSKIDAAAKAQNWSSAFLWAEQYFQYQVKAADAGLRAKKIISELGGQ